MLTMPPHTRYVFLNLVRSSVKSLRPSKIPVAIDTQLFNLSLSPNVAIIKVIVLSSYIFHFSIKIVLEVVSSG